MTDPEADGDSAEVLRTPLPDEPIVEVYVAANAIEAYGLAEALEERGIPAKVVNDEIGQAGGALPLGWVAAPRVWVHERDQVAAEELIAQWSDAKHQPETSLVDGSDDPETQAPAEFADDAAVDAAEADDSTARGAMSVLLFSAGFIIVLAGMGQALLTYVAGRSMSAESQAQLTPQGTYVFAVDGKRYLGVGSPTADAAGNAREVAPVHYDPRDPNRNVVGATPSAWPPLLAGLAVGGLTLFIAWRMG